MRAGHGRQPFLFDTPILALACDAQPEPIAVEGKARVGIAHGDRTVINAEKQSVSILPARVSLAARELDQLERMAIRIPKVDRTNAPGIRVPGR